MSNELLGNYSVGKVSGADYRLIFEIPDNCSYETYVTEGINYVNLTLNSGQSEPSAEFVTYKVDYTMKANALDITFKHKELKKPIVRLED